MITFLDICKSGVFVFRFPVAVIYLAVCLDELTKVLFVYPRFKKYLWLKNLTRYFEVTE